MAEDVVPVHCALGVVVSHGCSQLLTDLLTVGTHLRHDLLLLTDVRRLVGLGRRGVMRRRHRGVYLAIRRLRNIPAHVHRVMCAARHVLHVGVWDEGVLLRTEVAVVVGVGLVQGRAEVIEGRIVFEVLGHHEVAGNVALPAQIVRVCGWEHLKGILVGSFGERRSSEIEHF